MNSEAKNRPPRKPEPIETAEAAVLSTRMTASVPSGNEDSSRP